MRLICDLARFERCEVHLARLRETEWKCSIVTEVGTLSWKDNSPEQALTNVLKAFKYGRALL